MLEHQGRRLPRLGLRPGRAVVGSATAGLRRLGIVAARLDAIEPEQHEQLRAQSREGSATIEQRAGLLEKAATLGDIPVAIECDSDPARNPRQEVAGGTTITLGRRRQRIEQPRLGVDYTFDAGNRGVEQRQQALGEIATDRLGAEHRRQVSQRPEARELDFHCIELRCRGAVALELEREPEVAARTAAHQAIPRAIDRTARGLIGAPVGEHVELGVGIGLIGREGADDDLRAGRYRPVQDHAMPLAMVGLAVERRGPVFAG